MSERDELVVRVQNAMTAKRLELECDNMIRCRPDGSAAWSEDEIQRAMARIAIGITLAARKEQP